MASTFLAFAAGAAIGLMLGFLLLIFAPSNSDQDGMGGRDDG